MKKIICLFFFLLIAGCAGKVGDPDRNTGLADQATKDVIASGTDMTRREGEADNEDQIYTLRLSTEPTGDVIVIPSSSDPGAVTVDNLEGLTFTTNNWSEKQRIRVRPESDEDADDENVTIEHKVSGGGYDEVACPKVKVRVNDDDPDTIPEFNQSVEDQNYTKGTRIEPLRLPAATGGNGPLSYSLSDKKDDLPEGLRFDFSDSGGELTGIPTKVQEATTYTYTAMDSDRNTRLSDQAAFTFTIEVIDPNIIASFLIPWTGGHVEATKLGGIVVAVVGIIIIVGIITWYKSEIIGHIVGWAGYSRVVIKERKADFVMAIILMILGSVLGSVKTISGCE